MKVTIEMCENAIADSEFFELYVIALEAGVDEFFTPDLDELLSSFSPSEIVKKTVFGNVNLMDDLFTLDGYGNICSMSFDDAKDYLIQNYHDEILDYLKSNPEIVKKYN